MAGFGTVGGAACNTCEYVAGSGSSSSGMICIVCGSAVEALKAELLVDLRFER